MRVLIAPDKFKGTLTARQAAEAIARGWVRARPGDTVTLLPISDGGDGFGTVLSELLRARSRSVQTCDAAHRQTSSRWWWQANTHTAIIESANIVGLAMLPHKKFHPFQLDTAGIAAALNAARRSGARRIILGIGGSATNDGGFGLARALGWKFFTRAGEEICAWTELQHLHQINAPRNRWPRGLVTVAVDVLNPLLGKRGATRVYGPQKGVRPEEFQRAEKCLAQLAKVGERALGKDYVRTPGAGAAGGLGFGLATFVGARLVSGFELFAKHSRLQRALHRADLLVTGEGASDSSTLMGKGAGEVARRGRQRGIPVLGLAGSIRNPRVIKKIFISAHALTDLTTIENAQRQAAHWLERLAFRAAKDLTNPVARK